ncbi:MAG TPA: hypothetical protein VLH56_02415 [Dissulfurispiraceae bacterium]|nr:hypothetical protein [Dissulfurispiraceae bacterium]
MGLITFARVAAPSGNFSPTVNPDYAGYQQGRQWYQPKDLSDGGDPYVYSKGKKGKRYLKWGTLPDADLTSLLTFVAAMAGGRYMFTFTDVDAAVYASARIINSGNMSHREVSAGLHEVYLEVEVA